MDAYDKYISRHRFVLADANRVASLRKPFAKILSRGNDHYYLTACGYIYLTTLVPGDWPLQYVSEKTAGQALRKMVGAQQEAKADAVRKETEAQRQRAHEKQEAIKGRRKAYIDAVAPLIEEAIEYAGGWHEFENHSEKAAQITKRLARLIESYVTENAHIVDHDEI